VPTAFDWGLGELALENHSGNHRGCRTARGKKMPKPYIVSTNPSSGTKQAVITEKDFSQDVSFSGSDVNSYFLQWRSGAYTECTLDLNHQNLTYFFTSDMSGCSLWYNYNNQTKVMNIRHEARPGNHQQHIDDGYTLVGDTNNNDISLDLKQKPDSDGMLKTATYYVPYAIIDHGGDAPTVTFHMQLVRLFEDSDEGRRVFDLQRDRTVTVR
jgi:hypothetical protein